MNKKRIPGGRILFALPTSFIGFLGMSSHAWAQAPQKFEITTYYPTKATVSVDSSKAEKAAIGPNYRNQPRRSSVMKPPFRITGVAIPVFSLLWAGLAFAETTEIRTYYPAPASQISNLRANDAAIGQNFKSQTPPTSGLIVEGDVGLGRVGPGGAFHVERSVDGDVPLFFGNNLLPTAGSTNETLTLNFLFGNPLGGTGVKSAGYIRAGKDSDYTSDANVDSYLSFATAWNDFNVERMRITGAGNVGIGITSPFDDGTNRFRLEVSDSATGNSGLRITNTNTTGTSLLTLGQNVSAGAAPFYILRYGSTHANAGQVKIANADPSGYLAFFTGGDAAAQERLRITSTGLVGIGTTAPSERLHVGGNIRVTGQIFGGGTTWLNAPVKIWDPAGQENLWIIVDVDAGGVDYSAHHGELAIIKAVVTEAEMWVQPTNGDNVVSNQKLIVKAKNNDASVSMAVVLTDGNGEFKARYSRTDPASFNVELWLLGFVSDYRTE